VRCLPFFSFHFHRGGGGRRYFSNILASAVHTVLYSNRNSTLPTFSIKIYKAAATFAFIRHGFERYNMMRLDPGLCFLAKCGPPDNAAVQVISEGPCPLAVCNPPPSRKTCSYLMYSILSIFTGHIFILFPVSYAVPCFPQRPPHSGEGGGGKQGVLSSYKSTVRSLCHFLQYCVVYSVADPHPDLFLPDPEFSFPIRILQFLLTYESQSMSTNSLAKSLFFVNKN
jgi:hypothetical protein